MCKKRNLFIFSVILLICFLNYICLYHYEDGLILTFQSNSTVFRLDSSNILNVSISSKYFYPHWKLPKCLKRNIDIINENIYERYNYSARKLLSNVKFYIYDELPFNISYHNCWTVFAEERFQYLSYHTNRVYEIENADIIILKLEGFMEQFYPCNNAPFYRYITYNEMNRSWHWDNIPSDRNIWGCGYNVWQHHKRDITSFINIFSERIKNIYPNKWILIIVSVRLVGASLKHLENVIIASHDWQISRDRNMRNDEYKSFNDSKFIMMIPPIVNNNKMGQHHNMERFRNLYNDNNNNNKYDICHDNDKLYNISWKGTIRTKPQIRRPLYKYNNIELGTVVSVGHHENMQYDYQNLTIYTDYVLCPQGMQGFTFRFRETIQSSNIPIIIEMDIDNHILPYRKVINWTNIMQNNGIVLIDGQHFIQKTNHSIEKNRTLDFKQMFLKNLSKTQLCDAHQTVNKLRQTYFDGVHGEMETLLLNLDFIVNVNK